jgi:hypothetical protein
MVNLFQILNQFFSLICKLSSLVLRTILACTANDFTVLHETNSLPGNKMYVARLNRFERKWADLADQLNNLPGPNKTVKE